MRTIAPIAIVALLWACQPQKETATGTATGTSPQPANTSTADANFVTQVGQAGFMEIASGTLTQTNSSNPGVQTFGYLMITNHTLLNEHLARIAAQQGIPFPTGPSPQQQQMLDQLDDLTGPPFDQMYLADMVAGHQGAVSLFQSETSSQDPELAAYAKKYLPMVQEHLRLAQALQGQNP
ncbi:MAG TPA: DUF4142 domain-containing protein [Thermoanaerobaculia bacterium]|nr:DUF4142 domain-containing protein [Thermoanaerobaculia bacterium]